MQNVYRSPTISSLSKMRRSGVGATAAPSGYGEQVSELRKAVKMLKRDAEEELKLEYESQKTFEYLNAQITVLRDAFATLSDVLLEEFEHVRGDIAANSEEISTHVSQNKQAVQTLKGQINNLRDDEDGIRVAFDAKFNPLLDGVNGLQEECAQLRKDLSSSRHDLSTQAAVQHELKATLGVMEMRDADRLRDKEKSHRDMEAVRTAVTAITDRVARSGTDNARLTDGLSELAGRVDRMQSDLHELQRFVSDSLAQKFERPSSADAEAVLLLRQEVHDLRKLVYSIKQEQSIASSALAQDVHTLAEEQAVIKAGVTAQVDTVYERLRVYMMGIEKQQADVIAAHRQNMEKINADLVLLADRQTRTANELVVELKQEHSQFKVAVDNRFNALMNSLREDNNATRARLAGIEDACDRLDGDARNVEEVLGAVNEAVDTLSQESHHVTQRLDEADVRAKQQRAELQVRLDRAVQDLQAKLDGVQKELQRRDNEQLYAGFQ